MNGDLMNDVVTEVSVTGAVTTDGRLRFRSPLDVEAWAHGHLLARLAWEYLIDGHDNGVPRDTDSALERVRTRLIPEAVRPCRQGVPCSEVQIQWLGFVNIPLLSFVAFSTLTALLIAARARSPR
jgi:hypothetical protein